MDIFEAEENYPSRTVQQDEEEQAHCSASLNLQPPIVLWNKAMRRQLYPDGVMPRCMVVATSKVSCALLNSSFPEKKVLGTCVLPEVSMRGAHAAPSLKDRTCFIYACGGQGELLLVCCQYDVPPERTVALTKGLFRELCPKHVLVLGSVGSELLRGGEGDPSQEPLVYLLATSAAKQAAAQRQQREQVPYLPTGSIASGVPAAVLSYCQVRGMSAELLVAVDMVPSLLPLALGPLASAARALMGRQDLGQVAGGAASSLVSPPCLRAALAELEQTYSSSLQGVGAVFA